MGDSLGKEVRLALEGDVAHAAKTAVHRRVSSAAEQSGRAVPALRHQPQNRLQVGRPLHERLRARRPVTATSSKPQGGGGLARRRHRGGSQTTTALGAEEASGGAFASQSRSRVAVGGYVRAYHQAQWACHPKAPASAN